LVLAPGSAAVKLHVSLAVIEPGERGDCALEHIALGTVERTSDARRGNAVASPDGISVVAASGWLEPLTAVAAATLSAASPLALFRRWRARPTDRVAQSAPATFLVNGWQTFSFAGALHSDEAQPTTSLPYFSGAFHTGATPPVAAAPAALVSDLFALLLWNTAEGEGGGEGKFNPGAAMHVGGDDGGAAAVGSAGGVLIGFLTALRGVGGVATHEQHASSATLFTELPAGLVPSAGTLQTDWAMIVPIPPDQSAAARTPPAQGTEQHAASAPAHLRALHAYARYVDALALHSNVPSERAGRGALMSAASAGTASAGAAPGVARCHAQRTPIGWCSWYCHGPQVSEPLMLSTIEALGSARASGTLPIELVQLDDGWQSAWGDWTTPHSERFPRGLKPVSDAAKAAGMGAGLWMAPAALSSRSKLMAAHPEWVLRSASGKPLKCGWSTAHATAQLVDAVHPCEYVHASVVVPRG
jgi:hypothetical protein